MDEKTNKYLHVGDLVKFNKSLSNAPEKMMILRVYKDFDLDDDHTMSNVPKATCCWFDKNETYNLAEFDLRDIDLIQKRYETFKKSK